MQKFKRWIRRKYLFWKYKHNYNTGMVIVSKLGDRGLGLTTMMLEDCLRKNCMLLVPNAVTKCRMFDEIDKMVNSPTCTSSIDPNDYLITPTEIANGKLQGRHNARIIIDNQCTYRDFTTIRDNGYEHSIVNGFIYIPFAA